MQERNAKQTDIVIDLHAGPDRTEELAEVMHCAFIEYTRKGERSSAMLETPQSLREEMRGGTLIGIATTRVGEAQDITGDSLAASADNRTANCTGGPDSPEYCVDNRIHDCAADRTADRIIAMVKYQDGGDGTLYFCRLAVLPEFRGRRIAGMLVRALRAEALSAGFAGLSCTVRTQETGNLAMYEQLGMTVVSHGYVVSATKIKRAVVHMRDADLTAAPR